jgi:hypothetical protein
MRLFQFKLRLSNSYSIKMRISLQGEEITKLYFDPLELSSKEKLNLKKLQKKIKHINNMQR